MAAGRMGGSLRRESSVIFFCLREAEPVQEAAGDDATGAGVEDLDLQPHATSSRLHLRGAWTTY
jgi:hypothetical protein